MLPKCVVFLVCAALFIYFFKLGNCDVITIRSNTTNQIMKSYYQKLFGDGSLQRQDSSTQKMFVVTGVPLNGCHALLYPPILEGIVWTVLLDDTGCGLEKKMDWAKTRGYSALIVFSTKSQSPVPLDFVDSSWIPNIDVSFLGYADGLDLKNHYAWGLGKELFYAKFELLPPLKYENLRKNRSDAAKTNHTITIPQVPENQPTVPTPILNEEREIIKNAIPVAIIAGFVLCIMFTSCIMLSKRYAKNEKEPTIEVPVPAQLQNDHRMQREEQLLEVPGRIQEDLDQNNHNNVHVIRDYIFRGISSRSFPAYTIRDEVMLDIDRQLFNNLNRHLHHLLDNVQDNQYSKAQLKRLLQKFTWKDTVAGENAEDSCSICLENFTAGEKLRRLPCDHHFHELCIIGWLTLPARRQGCPLCRKFLSEIRL